MKLQDYLKSEGLTVRQFADQIGETESAVRKWVYGQRQPSLPAAVAVERATKGAVTSSDLLLSDASPAAALPDEVAAGTDARRPPAEPPAEVAA